ncbi:MAG: BMP family ABC transporter substrate-binding protein [Actinomycetota bacterium]
MALVASACGNGGDEGTDGSTTDGSTSSSDTAPEQGAGYQIAFLYDGPIDDGGWNTSFKAAADSVGEQLPGATITNIENVSPGDQLQAAMSDLASQGYDLIVGTQFAQPDMLKIAPDFPDTKFLGWGGWKTADNVGQFSGATEDGRYLDGIVAGSVTEANIVGYVAGFPIPEVVRGINAFILGAQSVNPDVQVIPVYTNSWYDPAKEREAAQSLVDAGADILVMETNTPAVASVAERNGVGMIGYGWDQSARSPNTWLSSFTFDWGPHLAGQAVAVVDGTWQPEVFYGGVADEMVGLSPFGSGVPQEVQDLTEEQKQAIASGALDVLAGPISDNQGTVVVSEGETIPPEERPNCCDWYAAGIQGTVPSG